MIKKTAVQQEAKWEADIINKYHRRIANDLSILNAADGVRAGLVAHPSLNPGRIVVFCALLTLVHLLVRSFHPVISFIQYAVFGK